MEEQSPVSDCFNLRRDLPRITAPTFLFEWRPFFLIKCDHFWTNVHTSASLQQLRGPFSSVHCGIKEMPSNPIKGEWEQRGRGAGNSNFVQLVPAVTSLRLNEPLDNPQKYDPSKGGKEAACSVWVPSRDSFNRSLSSQRHHRDTDELGGTRKWQLCFCKNTELVTCPVTNPRELQLNTHTRARTHTSAYNVVLLAIFSVFLVMSLTVSTQRQWRGPKLP